MHLPPALLHGAWPWHHLPRGRGIGERIAAKNAGLQSAQRPRANVMQRTLLK